MTTDPSTQTLGPQFEPPAPEPWEVLSDPSLSDPAARDLTSEPSPWSSLDARSVSPQEVETGRVDADPATRSMGIAPEAVGAPDAVEHEKTLSGRERLRQAISVPRGSGIEWVRPTEFFTRAGASASGRGIDYTAALSQTSRSAAWAGMRTVGSKARNLPPLSSFGRGGHTAPTPARTSVGMS
ncbi:hypothetical protein GCM10011359_18730 [Nesterenkonia alkaliphila]|nr:hypothetical protein GCM10011359_18730 [Nesterenkonia alkaliphila]